jgi:membrane-associated phospholipid phosphatase
MRNRSIAVLGLLAIASVLPAQSVGRILEEDFRNAAKDIGSIWASPFNASGRDWLGAGGAAVAFGLATLADQQLSDWAIRNKDTPFFEAIGPLRRGGVLFSGKYVIPPVIALYAVGVATKNQNMRDFVMGCMSSWVAQGVTRRVIAYTIGRARPDTMPNDPQHWELGAGSGNWMMRSFPAGHLANIMGCATFANERFQMGFAEPLIYGLAAGVGVGRMADEAHWFSDTVIGGILGYAVGREVARRSLNREVARSAVAPQLNVSPGLGGLNFSLNWSF